MQTQTQTPTLVYSAELVEQDGVFTLVVTDRTHDTVQSVQVPKRAVDKLPYFLSLLTSRQFGMFR
ncbi:hypothetical protein [Streptomyces acidiscabies]|uniref:Uncharacterized protein n=1 Tax=Streptomyces acidiscabies TaxID=42234 RepID=A0A0L0JGL7_9ACTN|nr:hypothetical protein [Streptomyces acidiscabies]KND24748.1 hypothetical protein IQ63_41825 [Streptomyces acidiscabies]